MLTKEQLEGMMRHNLYLTVIAAVCCVSLCGCATPYKESSLMGGYSDIQIDSNTVKVSFRGNGYTSKDTVETYMLYRCAEVTVEKGFDWFAIVSENEETKHGAFNTPGYYTGSGNTAGYISGNNLYATSTVQGTYFPPQTIHFQKHRAYAMIKMYKGKKPQDAPIGVYDAKEVVKFMGPKIKPKEQ